METSREDVGIAVRSAFLRKGTQQRFSLLVLVIISISLLLIESVETKPLNYLRSIIKDTIYRSSLVVSGPSKGFNYVVQKVKDHTNLYNNLNQLKQEIFNWKGLENLDLASIVTTPKLYKSTEGTWNIEKNKYDQSNNHHYNIVCLDFGIKRNILRNLSDNHFLSNVLPANSSLNNILKNKPKGIFLSNGPGDPFATGKIIIPVIQELIKKEIPIFGICLGHQILSLALGAKTRKMFQGHRGGNHPVKNLETLKVEITSQNHGFEVDKSSLSDEIIETHISLFDGTNEGIKHKKLPIFSVQYHPEASPGPHDSHYLFKQFYELVKKYA